MTIGLTIQPYTLPIFEQDCPCCLIPMSNTPQSLEEIAIQHQTEDGTKHPLHLGCCLKWLEKSDLCMSCKSPLSRVQALFFEEKIQEDKISILDIKKLAEAAEEAEELTFKKIKCIFTTYTAAAKEFQEDRIKWRKAADKALKAYEIEKIFQKNLKEPKGKLKKTIKESKLAGISSTEAHILRAREIGQRSKLIKEIASFLNENSNISVAHLKMLENPLRDCFGAIEAFERSEFGSLNHLKLRTNWIQVATVSSILTLGALSVIGLLFTITNTSTQKNNFTYF